MSALTEFYNQWFLDIWIIAAGALTAMSCALLGNYLVLRKMSMMGDAISHAVLPGLAIAFLLSGSRDSLPMFIGACIVGVVTALLVHLVHRFGKLDEGASMGVIFTTLFAIGLILIRQAADKVDLDPSCVLYGAIELSPIDTYDLFGYYIPRAVLTNGAVFILNLLFVIVFFKELKISSFDPALATTVGINAGVMHYLLMTLVAITTVAAFESVGSILVIAMLIVPASCAFMLTQRLKSMIVISLIVGFLCALLGHISAITVPKLWGFQDTNTAGMMAAVAGLLFLLTMFLAPKQGIFSRMFHQAVLSVRITRDDILAFIFRHDELDPENNVPIEKSDIRQALHIRMIGSIALWDLKRKKFIHDVSGNIRLTKSGQKLASELIRSHRLWESYLVNQLGLRPDHVHTTAEKLEHFTDLSMLDRLDQATGNPETDPHLKKIPRNN